MNAPPSIRRAAFISTRIAGTDGVSLEIGKWTDVIERSGVSCYFIAGELDRPAERCALIEEAHFNHPDILSISRRAFEDERRTPELTNDIMKMSRRLRDRLHQALHDLRIQAMIIENALTIPMNLPLGIALVQEIQECGIPVLAHHHDFFWERERFLVNAVDDLMRYAFPPALPQIQHVVINSLAGEEFSRRTGLSCRIIPNVMDFENPPPPPDAYAKGFRQAVGLTDEDLLILQPTRVVERKGIKHSIELIHRLRRPHAHLVITHEAGDEGDSYGTRVREFAEIMGVELIFADHCISEVRGTDRQGRPQFTIGDAYHAADLVAYPSEYEGFGNAFLEAIYYRKPILCNRYAIYRTDIEPMGFQVVLFDGFLTQATIAEVARVLDDPHVVRDMADHNYAVAREFFSYEALEQELRSIFLRPQNIYRLVGRRGKGC